MKGSVILTSLGLTTGSGFDLLEKELNKDGDLSKKVIFLFYEPYGLLRGDFLRACLKMGFCEENILFSESDKWPEDRKVDYVFVGEGNTFVSMRLLRDKRLFEKIRSACMEEGTVYLGASAGAIIAGSNISSAKFFDREEARLEDWEREGLGLVHGIVFPHMSDPDELAGIDMDALLKGEDGSRLMPYLIANDGIVVVPGGE